MAQRTQSGWRAGVALLAGFVAACVALVVLVQLTLLDKPNQSPPPPGDDSVGIVIQTKTWPGLEVRPQPGPSELPSRELPSLAARTFVGHGNPAAAPPELLGVLGETRFRVQFRGGPPVYSPDGKWLAVPSGFDILLFDCGTGALVQRLSGHVSVVVCVAFRPDGRELASGSEDHSVRLWDLDTGLERPVMGGHFHHIAAVAYSPDGTKVASAGLDGLVFIWDAARGKRHCACRGHTSWAHGLAFHPSGRLLASGAADHTVRVWDADKGTLLHTLPHDIGGSHLSVAFSPDGHHLAGGSDTQVRVWQTSDFSLAADVETPGGVLAFLPDNSTLLSSALVHAPNAPHSVRRWSLQPGGQAQSIDLGTRGRMAQWGVSPDGKTLAALGYPDERTVRFVDTATGQPVAPVEPGHTGAVEALVHSADGKTLFTGSADCTIRIWDIADGKCLKILQGHRETVRGLALSPDGTTLASASHDRTIRLWNVVTGEQLAVLEGHGTLVESVAWSPNGDGLAAGGELGTVSLWDARTHQRRWHKTGREAMVEGLCFTPDGQHLVCSSDNGLLVRAASDGAIVDTLAAATGVMAPALLPDGTTVAAGGWDGHVYLWSLRTGSMVRTFKASQGAIHQAIMSPDGNVLAVAGRDGVLRLWYLSGNSPRAQALVLRPFGSWLPAIQFSPDGKTLAVGLAGGVIARFRVPPPPAVHEQMDEVLSFDKHTHEFLETCAVLPDGKRAVSAGFDKRLYLWDLATGAEIRLLEGHAGGITSVAVLPDGQRAITASSDMTLRVWDLATGEQLQRLEGHTAMVRKVSVARDGRWAASAAEDKSVRLWDLQSGTQAKQFDGHYNVVRSVALSPDAKFILSGGEDLTVRLWDVDGGQQVRIWERFAAGVWAVAFSPDGKRAAWADGTGSVGVWDLATGARLQRWHLGPSMNMGTYTVRGLAYSPDGRQLLVSALEGSVTLIDLESGRVRDRIQSAGALTVAWTPNAGGAISTHMDKKVRVWRLPAPPVELVPLPNR